MDQQTPRKATTFREKMAMHRMLSELLSKPDGEGYVNYMDGWSDERVAAKFNVNAHAIASMRKNEFGNLRIGAKPGAPSPMHRFMDNTNARLSRLERMIGILEDELQLPENK